MASYPSESARVQAWRDRKRQGGHKQVVVWLSAEEETRLRECAAQSHCSPADLLKEAFSQWSPTKPALPEPPLTRNDIRELVLCELQRQRTLEPPPPREPSHPDQGALFDSQAATRPCRNGHRIPATEKRCHVCHHAAQARYQAKLLAAAAALKRGTSPAPKRSKTSGSDSGS